MLHNYSKSPFFSHVHNQCTVPDLPVCVDQRGGPQCCSTQFILNRLTMTEQDFIDGLRLELMERFMAFDTLVERLRTCKSTL